MRPAAGNGPARATVLRGQRSYADSAKGASPFGNPFTAAAGNCCAVLACIAVYLVKRISIGRIFGTRIYIKMIYFHKSIQKEETANPKGDWLFRYFSSS